MHPPGHKPGSMTLDRVTRPEWDPARSRSLGSVLEALGTGCVEKAETSADRMSPGGEARAGGGLRTGRGRPGQG